MLKGKLIHPEILQALGSAGHGSQILISDGHYPHTTGSHPDAKRVFLNLAPGKVTVPDVLEALASAIPIEAARAIWPDDDHEPPIFAEYRALLPGIEIGKLGRFPFYEAARERDTALVIATGEQRTWACILLTIGVISAW
jgi:L-fucose mutarotase